MCKDSPWLLGSSPVRTFMDKFGIVLDPLFIAQIFRLHKWNNINEQVRGIISYKFEYYIESS